MTQHLQRELAKLKRKILSLCAMAEESLQMAVKALETRDSKLAKEVIERDYSIDQEEVEVEEECLKLLALHQPVAIDLRFIVAVLKINSDLERIGDLSAHIAERALVLQKSTYIPSPINLAEMADKVKVMLEASLDSLVNMDTDLARKVLTMDDHVDETYRRMYEAVIKKIQENSEEVVVYLNLLSVSRQLERIADHVTNICEDIIYMADGEIIRHQRPNAVVL
ncbi:MAG: phosphate signaling complex protein PhoU [Pirellulaceae bacterium]|nr:phosphate signaling complex protein PhoU [Pirellulaceae bacterium]